MIGSFDLFKAKVAFCSDTFFRKRSLMKHLCISNKFWGRLSLPLLHPSVS